MISTNQFPKVINYPVKVTLLGFESDTVKLHRSGWQLSMNQDYAFDKWRLAIHHPGLNLYGISNTVEFRSHLLSLNRSLLYDELANFFKYEGFRIMGLSHPEECQMLIDEDFNKWAPVSGIPQLLKDSYNDITAFNIFRPLDRVEDLIVMPEMVPELLDKIRAAQAPKQAEIREKLRRSIKSNDPVPAYETHAQIITLAA